MYIVNGCAICLQITQFKRIAVHCRYLILICLFIYIGKHINIQLGRSPDKIRGIYFDSISKRCCDRRIHRRICFIKILGNQRGAGSCQADIAVAVFTRNKRRVVVNAGRFIPNQVGKIRVILLGIHGNNIIFLLHIRNLLCRQQMDAEYSKHFFRAQVVDAAIIANLCFHAMLFQKMLQAKCTCDCVRVRIIVCLDIIFMSFQ